jgi:hypothetical protein
MQFEKCERLLLALNALANRIAPHARLLIGVAGVVLVWGILYALTTAPKDDNSRQSTRAKTNSTPSLRNFNRTNSEQATASIADGSLASDGLAQLLYTEYPELNSNNPTYRLSDWEKVNRLREFSYRCTAFANSLETAAYRAGAAMVDKVIDGDADLVEAYQFFDEKKGGVLCGHAAEMLHLLYEWAGFDSLYLNIGFEASAGRTSRFTHALNLVRIQTQDSNGRIHTILSVQDPTLNVAYGNEQGGPIDYFEMLDKLIHNRADQVHFVVQATRGQPRSDPNTVAFGNEIESSIPKDFARSWNVGLTSHWSATTDGRWVFTGPRTIWAFERLGDEDWKPALFEAGLPPQTIYLHCFPLDLRGTPDAPLLLKRAQEVLHSVHMASTSAAAGASD